MAGGRLLSRKLFLRRKAAGYGLNETPKTSGLKGAHFWELQNGQNPKAGTAISISLLVPLLEFNQRWTP
jgi:hypothetical protein